MDGREIYNQLETLSEIPVAGRFGNVLGPNGETPRFPLSSQAAAVKATIDECASEIIKTFRRHGLKADNSDPIERVVNALTIYALESDNDLI